MENGEFMKEILELIYTLEGELDDSYYSLPEYDANSDGKSYLDSGRNTVYELKTKLEELKKEIDLNV
jgi:hypothetical protein|tara:strand:- start:182 stop:382 length:201 start_codon:yes stop_codon:yes gene_type:complete